MNELTQRLRVGREAALIGGQQLMSYWRKPLIGFESKTSPGDFVSEADRSAETRIRAHLHAAFPDDAITGEEHEAAQGTTGWRWIIDPLDGTANFVRGLPCFSVSVGLEGPDGELAAGVVYDPVADEMFSAHVGGLVLIGIEGTPAPQAHFRAGSLEEAMYGGAIRNLGEQRAAVLERATSICGTRAGFGSAALMLAWLAIGRIDLVYFELNGLKEWDVAAGEAIARAAGLDAGFREPAHNGPDSRYIAGRPDLVGAFLALSEEPTPALAA